MNKCDKHKLTETKCFRTDDSQINILRELKSKYNIDISNFIRIAIREKIERDKYKLKEQHEEDKWPWSC